MFQLEIRNYLNVSNVWNIKSVRIRIKYSRNKKCDAFNEAIISWDIKNAWLREM